MIHTRFKIPNVFIAGLLLLLGVSSCGRIFIEESSPEIEILEPDLSTVFLQNTATIRISATSFRSIEKVSINGHAIEYDPDQRVWEGLLLLQKGLNTIIITAEDIEGLSQADTVFAVHLPFRVHTNFPTLPEPRGGHATTMLWNGSILVTGGAPTVDSDASNRAFFLDPETFTFSSLPAVMNVARTGHTAMRLPDGRVLILGGSRKDNPEDVDDLVETPEIFDFETNQFTELPIEGHPIRRTHHTATYLSVSQGLIIDLLGGTGDIRYGTNPVLATRSDRRRFLFRNDSLFALQPSPIGYYADEAVAGHVQVRLRSVSVGQPNRYLVAGNRFSPGGITTTSFIIDYTNIQGVVTFGVDPMWIQKTRHAAAPLQNGHVLVFGGHQGEKSAVINSIELYIEGPDQYFRFPYHESSFKRFGHTATKISPERILLLGGFSQSGNGLILSEVFDAMVY